MSTDTARIRVLAVDDPDRTRRDRRIARNSAKKRDPHHRMRASHVQRS